MWFNSIVNEKSYLGLTSYRFSHGESQDDSTARLKGMTGAAWRSSARDVNRNLNWRNERNPCSVLQVSQKTASFNEEEGEEDVSSAWPLCPGQHT